MQLILALFSKYTRQYEFPAKNGQIQIPTYQTQWPTSAQKMLEIHCIENARN